MVSLCNGRLAMAGTCEGRVIPCVGNIVQMDDPVGTGYLLQRSSTQLKSYIVHTFPLWWGLADVQLACTSPVPA